MLKVAHVWHVNVYCSYYYTVLPIAECYVALLHVVKNLLQAAGCCTMLLYNVACFGTVIYVVNGCRALVGCYWILLNVLHGAACFEQCYYAVHIVACSHTLLEKNVTECRGDGHWYCKC